jgi:eukaryotic-like serine/threonine-protein kinase
MGSVWAGRHVSLDQLVAIKFIHPNLAGSPEALRRFYTEAKAAARIKSRHAVTVYDHGVTEAGQPYIVMEYLEGEPLETAIRERGPLPLPEVVEIVSQAASALEVAHEAGVVHRDLKPDNIFLATDREAKKFGYTVKLVDFGIAKIVHDEAAAGAAATQAGTVLGTPHYMSPEALTASAPVSAASDVWSLAACAFAAVCARTPFTGDAIGEVVLKVVAAPLPIPSKINPKLPKAFDEWFAKGCARNAAERFSSVGELANALRELEQWQRAQREEVSYEIRPTQPSALELDLPEPRTPGRALVLAGLLVGAALTLGVLGYYVYQHTREANEAIARASASAAAAIQAENDKKLNAADRAFWASVNEAGVDGGVEAGAGAEAGTDSNHASPATRRKLHGRPGAPVPR